MWDKLPLITDELPLITNELPLITDELPLISFLTDYNTTPGRTRLKLTWVVAICTKALGIWHQPSHSHFAFMKNLTNPSIDSFIKV